MDAKLFCISPDPGKKVHEMSLCRTDFPANPRVSFFSHGIAYLLPQNYEPFLRVSDEDLMTIKRPIG